MFAPNSIVLAEKFALLEEFWSPRIVAELNGQWVKIAKGKGELIWHSHDNEDELFQVFKGQLTIHMRDHSVTLNPGDMYVVPRGVEHKPEAIGEVWIVLFEPKTTAHTGTTQSEQTVAIEDQNWI
ncbi:MAG: cupin domain-containing protein [Alteromonas sp.]